VKLPNGARAIVDIRKLREYCLNPQHPRGRNKARVFAAVGMREADAEELRTALVAAASAENRENPQHLDCPGTGGLAAADELLCTIRERFAMADIEVLSVVALLQDLPEEGLVRGQVGTVVESWAPGVYEVEFSDDNGKTYAMVALKAGQLMRLHHEPANQAA